MAARASSPVDNPRPPRDHAGGMLIQRFAVRDYDLGLTLCSGQAFRWTPQDGGWEGVVHGRWIHLRQPDPLTLEARVAQTETDWSWLTRYLRLNDSLPAMIETWPHDPPLLEAARALPGLRLLRQDPWECLASFILSSTKQIVQIRQMIGLLCARYGTALPTPPDHPPAWSFPQPETLAAASESDLRACRLGFRAPYLQQSARRIARRAPDLAGLATQPLPEGRRRLQELPGVGRKIADCVLLFACGHDAAFPVDVWVLRALRQLYFPRRAPTPARLLAFTETHFGPCAGLAQQYLFEYIRRTTALARTSSNHGRHPS